MTGQYMHYKELQTREIIYGLSIQTFEELGDMSVYVNMGTVKAFIKRK